MNRVRQCDSVSVFNKSAPQNALFFNRLLSVQRKVVTTV